MSQADRFTVATLVGPGPDEVNHLTIPGSDIALCGYDASGCGFEGDPAAREQKRDDCAACWEFWRSGWCDQ